MMMNVSADRMLAQTGARNSVFTAPRRVTPTQNNSGLGLSNTDRHRVAECCESTSSLVNK